VRGPVSRLLPRSRGHPQVVPVSNGESISTASANAAQEPEVNYFGFFRYPHGIHKRPAVIRIGRWLSTGLFTISPQATWYHRGRSAPAVAFGTFSSSISATAGFWRRTRGGDGARNHRSFGIYEGGQGQYGGALAAEAWPGRGEPIYWRLLMPGRQRRVRTYDLPKESTYVGGPGCLPI
jgi:hypothetical protein